jgi:hypothetical protein
VLLSPSNLSLELSISSGDLGSGLAHLGNVHTINFMMRNLILVDEDMSHLGGVQCLDLSSNHSLTDQGFAYLSRLHTLILVFCDAGLAHLSNSIP